MSNKNSGFSIINGDAANLTHKTVLVVGIGRGGTSMVAGVLSKLGIFMGEGLSSRYQDNALLDCLQRNDKKQAKKIIKERNSCYPVWGVKKLRLWRWNHLFRERVYVVILRDIFATANRRVTLYNISLLSEMFKVLGLNFSLLLFLWLTKRPLFIASYEKALMFPEEFVTGLSVFLGLENPIGFTDAVQFINPSPPTYTNTLVKFKVIADNKTYQGYIDALEARQIIGWAVSLLNTGPVVLDLFVNGLYKQTVSTHLSRLDVSSQDPRFYEHCGFVFYLPEEDSLRPGDTIEVKIAGQNIALNNSPQEFI